VVLPTPPFWLEMEMICPIEVFNRFTPFYSSE
jgi:hypothetical protein